MFVGQQNKSPKRRFWSHFTTLLWKSYMQRKRLWRLLLLEIFLALLLIGLSIIVSRPIFLTPVRETAEPALKTEDIIQALDKDTYLGYAPAEEPYESIMKKAAEYLQIPVRGAKSITELEDSLYLNYSRSEGVVRFPVVWVIFDSETGNNFWKFKIRSRASPGAFVQTYKEVTDELQQQLGSGLLAAQVAVSQAVLQRAAPGANYEVRLQPMPESPLTQEVAVKRALVWMLLCLALALLPPVLDTVALVASETNNGFKRALCLRDVDFSVIYLGWLSYAFFTTLPVCMITAIYLIFTFRWIKLWSTFLFVMSYQLVMLMMAFILTMFHDTAAMACIWVASMVVAQMFICLQFAHYNFGFLSMFLQVFMPPMGLSNAMHSFALLQIGRGESTTLDSTPIYVTNWCWVLVSILYFGVLMMMQRTLGRQRAIRGQVPWKSLFKWKKAAPQLHHVYVPTGKEREPLQEVDELVAKAISFNNVSKTSMGAVHLQDVTLDIYRGEYSMLYAERIQKSTPRTLEDLITGLTLPDEGTINILGRRLDGSSVVAPHMLGYCPHAISLLPDLTVQEHLYLFIAISMWNESSYFMEEYAHIRQQRLLAECGLEAVALVKISQLSTYYQAQVCWALAMLLEPRVVFIPNFTDKPVYVKVIIDKILQYQKHLTIVQTCISSIRLEYADRVFIFDHHRLIFGGTPAYMYFKYGRQYRVRLNLTGHRSEQHDENMSDLVKRIRAAGGSISIKFRTLLICRLPVSPTDSIEDLLRHLKENARQYGIKAVHLHLPDSEEICRRAISESTKTVRNKPASKNSMEALHIITRYPTWTRAKGSFGKHFKYTGFKFFACHKNYIFAFLFTLLSSILLGVLMGQSLTVHPAELAARAGVATEQDQLLTVEAARQRTTVVLRASSTPAALDVANAYIMSDERSGDNGHVTYTSLNSTDSLTEYLMIQAIHSPQQYVYKYAYGMEVEEVQTAGGTKLIVEAKYSPFHVDRHGAARSLARVYMALLRHYTDTLDANIHVVNKPLSMDKKPWLLDEAIPPFLIQVLMLLTVSHVLLLPSLENGLIRHTQRHAINFSPFQYWAALYLWDLILFMIMIVMISGIIFVIMHIVVPWYKFGPSDYLVIPTILVAYGVGAIPLAYLFSLGHNPTMNLLLYIIINFICGETTFLSAFFVVYNVDWIEYVLYMLSPQFTVFYAFLKIKLIFLNNGECMIFSKDLICQMKPLQKCCSKCGVLQACFEKKSYFTFKGGVLQDIIALIVAGTVYFTILMLWEYWIIKKIINKVLTDWIFPGRIVIHEQMPGLIEEKRKVMEKVYQLKDRDVPTTNPFGEYLLVNGVSLKQHGLFSLTNIYLGVGRGGALAVSGIGRHGRVALCELLAGYRLPTGGDALIMSKYSLWRNPHKYSQHVSLCCGRTPLPPWLAVRHALELIAVLRGISRKAVKGIVRNYIDALDLSDQAHMQVRFLSHYDRQKFHFLTAVIAAPPVIVLDEYVSQHQSVAVREAIYSILYHLSKRGHAVIVAASTVRLNLPVSDRLAIILNGNIYDIDHIDRLIHMYGTEGFIVVVHLKNDVDVATMFAEYFDSFHINDATEVLVNVQVYDAGLDWAEVFSRMERLQSHHHDVYSYIITSIPIDFIYNSIILKETWNSLTLTPYPCIFKRIFSRGGRKRQPTPELVDNLKTFDPKYSVKYLNELPWSVVFHK